jgi:hypothetical protein
MQCVVLIALLHCIVFATVQVHSFALIHSVLTNPSFVRPFYSPSTWRSAANSDDNEEASDSKGEIDCVNAQVDIEVIAFAEPPAVYERKIGPGRVLLEQAKDVPSDIVDDQTYADSEEFKKDRAKPEALDNGVRFVESIMKDYVDIPGSNGMKILENVTDFETGEVCRNLVVRNITEEFWNQVISFSEQPNTKSRVCALGTPGIGKTTSTAVLIRMLLFRGCHVVYRVRTIDMDEWVYEFKSFKIPDGNQLRYRIEVRAVLEKKFSYRTMRSLQSPSNYYVVDPGETKDSCVPNAAFKGRFILVTSPDERHWGETSTFIKGRRPGNVTIFGDFLYYPLWSLEELFHARKYILAESGNVLEEVEVEDRHYRFGGVPRNVFLRNVSTLEGLQNDAIKVANKDQIVSIALGKMDAIGDLAKEQPKSVILGLALAYPDADVAIKYLQRLSVIISDLVREKIGVQRMINLFAELRSSKFDPKLYEAYTQSVLLTEDCRLPGRYINGTDYSYDLELTIGGCRESNRTGDDIIQKAMENEKILFRPISKTYELIDFVHRDGNVLKCIQSTTGERHDCQEYLLYELVKSVCEMFFYNSTDISGLETDRCPRIHLIYMVPEFVYTNFRLNPVNPKLKGASVAKKPQAVGSVSSQVKTKAVRSSEIISPEYQKNFLQILSSEIDLVRIENKELEEEVAVLKKLENETINEVNAEIQNVTSASRSLENSVEGSMKEKLPNGESKNGKSEEKISMELNVENAPNQLLTAKALKKALARIEWNKVLEPKLHDLRDKFAREPSQANADVTLLSYIAVRWDALISIYSANVLEPTLEEESDQNL